jgi:hypothetical protein
MDILTRMFDPVALQSYEIVAIAEFREQVLKDFPAYWIASLSSSVLSTSISKTIG